MAKQAEGCAVLRLSKAAASLEGFGMAETCHIAVSKAWPKTCHVAVSKPNRNLWGGTMAKQAEGCAVLRLSKTFEAFKAWPKRAM